MKKEKRILAIMSVFIFLTSTFIGCDSESKDTVKRQTTTNSNSILFLLLVGTVRHIIPAKSLYQ